MARQPTPSSAVATPSSGIAGLTPALYRPRIEVTWQKPCNSVFRIYILYAGRLTQRYTRSHALEGIIWLLYLCLPSIFYCNKSTFSINRQPKLWWLRRHFETSWAQVPANKGVLERSGPRGSTWPGGVMSAGCLGCWDDHLVNSMGQHHQLIQCCWLDGQNE